MADEHKGLPVPGYVPQSQFNVDTVATNKRMEETLLQVLDGLATLPDVDKRWLAIGRTHIEEGFMAINRSVFKPSRVKLD